MRSRAAGELGNLVSIPSFGTFISVFLYLFFSGNRPAVFIVTYSSGIRLVCQPRYRCRCRRRRGSPPTPYSPAMAFSLLLSASVLLLSSTFSGHAVASSLPFTNTTIPPTNVSIPHTHAPIKLINSSVIAHDDGCVHLPIVHSTNANHFSKKRGVQLQLANRSDIAYYAQRTYALCSVR